MSTPSAQALEQAKQSLEKANNRRTRIQIQLESARQQYQAAAAEARAAYGTDSLPELEAQLVAMEANNTKATQEFCQAVTEFEAHIAAIERALTSPEALAEFLTKVPVAAPAPGDFGEEDI